MEHMRRHKAPTATKKTSKPPPHSGPKDATDTREILILAAMRLFAEQGFDATTTRQIVQATGLNISLISYYFGSKEGLMGACLSYVQEQIQDGASPSLSLAENPQDFAARIRAFIASFLRSHVENPFMHRVIQREYERDSAIFHEMVQTRYAQWYKKLTGFIAHAQKNSWIHEQIDPLTAAIALHGAMVQQVRLDRFRREIQGNSLQDPEHFARVVDDLARIFCEGLLAPSQLILKK